MKKKIMFYLPLIVLSLTNHIAQQTVGTVEEIICPCLVEYAFPKTINNYEFSYIPQSVPVLRFLKAVIKEKKLVCAYENEFPFLSPQCTERPFFAFMHYEGVGGDKPSFYPPSVKLHSNDPKGFLSDWICEGDVEIPLEDICFIPYRLCLDEHDLIYSWWGGKYSSRLTDASNPNLYRIYDGVAKLNEKGTGFLVAKSIQELFGEPGAKVGTSKQLMDNKQKSPADKSIIKKKPAINKIKR